MIKLVLTDIDGTILPAGARAIDARTMLAIRNLLATGIAFGPSSGRERDAIFQPFWGAPELTATGIFANGKVVYAHGERVLYEPLDHTMTLSLLDVLHPLRDTMFNYFAPNGLSGHGDRSYIVVDCPEDDFERIVSGAGLRTRRERTNSLPEGAELLSASVVTVGEPGRVDRVGLMLHDACPGFDFLKSNEHILDVSPHGVSKATALGPLCEHLGISPEEILYLGDSDNDLAMMRVLPNSIAMGNATDGAYEAARWCTGPSSADAVATILESLVRHDGEVHPEDWTF